MAKLYGTKTALVKVTFMLPNILHLTLSSAFTRDSHHVFLTIISFLGFHDTIFSGVPPPALPIVQPHFLSPDLHNLTWWKVLNPGFSSLLFLQSSLGECIHSHDFETNPSTEIQIFIFTFSSDFLLKYLIYLSNTTCSKIS